MHFVRVSYGARQKARAILVRRRAWAQAMQRALRRGRCEQARHCCVALSSFVRVVTS
jgi:hypothetical protein